jgi:glycosyltransferase involved in cell wall biosynthesis
MDASVRGDLAPVRRLPASNLSGLRIALVHDWLTGMRGGEKCLEVLCETFPDATLHTLIHDRGKLSPAIEAMDIRPSPLQRIPGVFRHYPKLLPIMPLATRAWKVGKVDLVVSLSHCVAKMVRAPRGVPHVCYCFTPMRYAWDMREAYLESWGDRPVRRALANRLLDRVRRVDRESADRVSHFVAISETIRDRIARCYGRESRVIQPPVDTHFYRPADVPRHGFYLCVSALVPYKNLDQAVLACSASGRRLIVIGSGPERRRLEALAGSSVTFLGWQSDEVIRDHYQRCRALIFPGEEDFGIVPIEALACQTPVIALGRGGVAETVDDRIGRTYPVPTVESLNAALEGWEEEGESFDPILARSRAEALALPVFRRRMIAYLAEVVGSSVEGRSIPGPHVPIGKPEGQNRQDTSIWQS